MTRVVHLHIADDFVGELHLHVGDSAGDGEPTHRDATHSSAVSEILRRFEAHDPTTSARAVLDVLSRRGWQGFPPASRTEGTKSKAAYVRLIYKGTKREASVYLNTVAFIFARKEASDLAEGIDNAELHADGSLYIYHSHGRVDEALQSMSLIERWADGDWGDQN